MEAILREHGSIQNYKIYLAEIKRQYAEDMASVLQKEEEKKAKEAADKRAQNEKNSMENQLKVARWMNDYDQISKEIIQEEIDVLAEMEREEKLAGLCLI